MSNARKRLAAIVAVVAIVSILAVCLCACNKAEDYIDRLEKAGYKVTFYDSQDLQDDSVEWQITAYKTGGGVYIIKYAKAADAKKAYKDAKDGIAQAEALGNDTMDAYRKGKVVITGVKQAVKDARS